MMTYNLSLDQRLASRVEVANKELSHFGLYVGWHELFDTLRQGFQRLGQRPKVGAGEGLQKSS